MTSLTKEQQELCNAIVRELYKLCPASVEAVVYNTKPQEVGPRPNVSSTMDVLRDTADNQLYFKFEQEPAIE